MIAVSNAGEIRWGDFAYDSGRVDIRTDDPILILEEYPISRIEKMPEALGAKGSVAVYNVLCSMARANCKPGQVFEIKRAVPMNYGRGQSMAWFTDLKMQSLPEVSPEHRHPVYNPVDGCYLVARLKCPST